MPIVSGGALVVSKSPTTVWSGTTADYGNWISSNGYWSTYAELYKRQLWVSVVVNKRAGMVARLPLPVYQRGASGRVRAPEHAYARLLARPNGRQDPFLFWQWTCSTWDIYGEAFWLKVRDAGGRPMELWPAHPTAMRLEADGTWTFTSSGVEVHSIKREDIVHFTTYNPDTLDRGLSRLEPLRETLANESAAIAATSAFWRNGARPGFALKHPGNLSQNAATRLRVQFDSLHAGADKTGSTLVLEEGMEAQTLTVNHEDAQYIETRKLNREEVVAAFDMPPPAVHILDRATFSNITEQFRSVYRDTMAPVLGYFESVLEHQLRGSVRMGASGPDFGDDVYAEFLLDEVLRGSFEARQDAYDKAKYMTVAEKRERENLPFIEGTDIILVNTADQPLSNLVPDPDAPADAKEPTPIFGYDLQFGIATIDERRAQLGLPPLPNGQGNHPPTLPGVVQAAATDESLDPAATADAAAAARSVLGRLSRPTSLAEVNPATLTAGLPPAAARVVIRSLDAALAAGEDVPALRARIKALAEEAP